MIRIYSICTFSLLFCILSVSELTAQSESFFIGKPDKNIKEITGYTIYSEKDSGSIAYIVSYNKNGELIKESQPEYYIEINYQYDKGGRLIEKDALYGESFANGTTYFYYNGDNIIEKTQALGFYSETHTKIDSFNKPLKIESFFVASGMRVSETEMAIFSYNKDNLLQRKEISHNYYNMAKEPGELFDTKTEILIKELEESPIINKEEFYEIYKYNIKNQLISKIYFKTKPEQKLWEVAYKYNEKGLLETETKTCYQLPDKEQYSTCIGYEIVKEYNLSAELIKITTTKKDLVQNEYYQNGKLIKHTEKYNDVDEVRHYYKYKYYTD